MTRAVVHTRYGGAEVLGLGEAAVPALEPEQVLVQVRAAGMDRGVWHMMTGLPLLGRLAFGLRSPRNPVPGMDLAGTVLAVGTAVSRFRVGDEVFGAGRGTFADVAVAAEDALVHKPAQLGFVEAAAVPVSGVTALKAAYDIGRIESGHRVAILGASGGVGSYAVQLAKLAGAHVTGVCSGAKADFVGSLGADVVLDHARDDFADGGPYDVVLDIAGNPPVAHLRRALSPRGTAVIVGGEGGGRLSGGMHRHLGALAVSPFVGQRLTMMLALVTADQLARLVPLLENGSIRPSVDRTFPLVQAAAAMEHLASGRVRGKIVLVP